MKKFAFAAVCTLAVVGFVLADEFGANITKVDGNKVTYFKVDKDTNKKADKESTSEASKDVKVTKAGGKKAPDPVPVEDGLKNALFTNIDATTGVNATITTDDKGMITQIVTKGGKGGKGAGGGKKGKAAISNGDVD